VFSPGGKKADELRAVKGFGGSPRRKAGRPDEEMVSRSLAFGRKVGRVSCAATKRAPDPSRGCGSPDPKPPPPEIHPLPKDGEEGRAERQGVPTRS